MTICTPADEIVFSETERLQNPLIACLDEARRLKEKNPALFLVEFRNRFHDPTACFVLDSDVVPAIGATHGEVFFYPSPAFLEFLAALSAGNGDAG
jgi:hypothetical protein